MVTRDFPLSILNERVCRYAGVQEWQMGPNAAVSTSQKKRRPVVMRVPGRGCRGVRRDRRPPYRWPRRIERVERTVVAAIAVDGEFLGFTGS